MSAVLTDRPAVVTRRFENEPRVQLLPSFVAQRAKNRSAVRLGILLAILGAVIAGGLFVYGVFRATAAALFLEDANATTLTLLEQQAEYRIATDTAAMVEQTSELQLVATSYEIDWAALIQQLQSFLPAGGLIMNLEATNQAPWEGSLEIEDPLRTPRIAMISVTVNTASIQEATAVVARLSEITGYADAVVVSTAVGVDGRVTTEIALTLATDAVSGRFLETEDDAATESASEESTDAVDDPATEEGGEG